MPQAWKRRRRSASPQKSRRWRHGALWTPAILHASIARRRPRKMSSYALQSLSGRSAIARLDMRVKFALLLMASTLIFIWNSVLLQAALLAAIVALMLAAGVRLSTLRSLVVILMPALILITIIQGLWSPFGVTPV